MKKIGPVFERVLRCYETKAEFARHLGIGRDLVNYWLDLGYIPADYVLRASQSCAAQGGRVAVNELLIEAERGKARVLAAGGSARARRVHRTPRVEVVPAVVDGASDA